MTTTLELIKGRGQQDADAPAVRDAVTSLTRSELTQRSEELAGRLAELGVRRGDRVAVSVERSAALIVALLGVLRAGAAYVAIDPTYPADRISWMLSDCPAAAVIVGAGDQLLASAESSIQLRIAADGRLAPRDPARTEQPGTRDSTTALASPGITDGGVPAGPLSGADAAYIVYTSGSTGRPKGVVIDHAGLLNLVSWHCEAFGLDDQDVCTQMASPGFDAAVWEIWPSLAAGAALLIVPEALRTDPLGLRDWMVDRQITVGFVPTAVAEGLITLDWPGDGTLRFMLTGGDALTRRPGAALPFTLVNNYGVSEAAVVATSGPVASSGVIPPSIGAPISGVLVELVDASGQPVPEGEDGELVLGGVAVGRGYLNLPELTAERFYEDERGRWYRTGDRMRLTPDGELEFLGRLDDQLSIRGFRVEAGEVAGALNAHPAISASVAVGAGESSAERRLVAYVVAVDGLRPSDAELTAFLATRLPEPMRPSSYVWLDALPMTAHGKVDRGALPEPGGSMPVTEVGTGTEPDAGEDVEATVAAIIADLLGVETIGVTENFFLLGGHSLLAAQLIVRIGELYDVEVSLRHLFDHPTASEIAQEIERERRAEAGEEPVLIDAGLPA